MKIGGLNGDAPEFHSGVARMGLLGINIAKGINGEKEMKKIMIDSRNGKIIAFGLVAVLLLIGTVSMASASYAGAEWGGLIAYYPFNGNAHDESGNGNDGAIDGATWVDNGGCGKALSFDGRDDYVEAPHPGYLAQGTIEGWVYLVSVPSSISSNGWMWFTIAGNLIDQKWDGVDFGVHPKYSQNLVFGIFDGDWYGADSGICPQSDKWHHFAGTWGSGGIKIYIDGNLKGQNSYTGGIPDYTKYTYIGANTWGGYVNATIDEVRIYNYARTQSQIQEDMRKCTPSTPTATAGPTPTTPTTPPANCIYFNTGAWTNLSSVFTNGTEIYGGTNNKYNGTAYMYLWLSFDSPQANISLRPCPDDLDPQAGEPNWGDRAGLAIEEIHSNELRSRLTADFVPYELRAELKAPYIYRTVVTAPDHGYRLTLI